MSDYEDEGVPTDVEDIAIVIWDARRALRSTQGQGSQVTWMHAPKAEKDEFVERVQSLLEDGTPDVSEFEDLEDRLTVAIVRALKV